MKPKKLHFALLALVALVLVLSSGYILKFNTPDSKGLVLGWGFVFFAGCIFFVRSMLIINRMSRQ